ncbi:MAG TPA: phosphodiester glycosidase family protein [Solirubrobacteraceae bacterium]|nr:phosphodiester glycosidase family protein [Solirubrobacteraceae bacterium]
MRVELADGLKTTVHVARHPRAETAVRLALLRRPMPLEAWCAARGVSEALVGGFFTRPDTRPLGEVRTRGLARRHTPFDAPWDAVRACLHVESGRPRIAPRDALAAQPRGDLLQAGPRLVHDGEVSVRDGRDPEGFSTGAAQFDSDITAGRYPRAALGIADGELLAVACDGRSRADAGLTLAELAALLVDLGARDAINLDGGGSTSLVCGGLLRNRPRKDFGVPLPGGRPVATALVFARR